ncbi:MAG: UDP-N-acetylmuramoyl-L-alanine--D-glutamate ligase [Rickettsiales bacterium]|nr:UDP-N-acetylmuramoyl-L-alanine--D-glutamate ligase [Rickettsiales bacterium]
MILLPAYKGKKIAVMGLGISGQATVASLSASGAEVYAWDESEANLALCQSAHRDVVYADYRKWPWKEIDALVLSPGVPLHYPQPHPIVGIAMVYGCEIFGDVELLMQAQPDAKFVGITGTNGKSTVTALTAHLLEKVGAKVQMGGNIGNAALSLEPLGKGGIYVIEMSSYQNDLMMRSTFNVAVLLNISPDHLERHGGMEGYVAAKKRIFDGMGVQDTAIISVDDAHSKGILKDLRDGKNLYSWQNMKPQFVELKLDESSDRKLPVDLSVISTLQGKHNKQNALAAIAICEALGYKASKLASGLRSFSGLAHRMQPLGKKNDVKFINDSKATNAEAAARALDTYDDIYWILGGIAKEGGIESLTEYFPKVTKAYVIGEAADEFAELLKEHKVQCVKSATLDKAVASATEDAMQAEQGVVLLSPACSSFDQFPNFEKRGEYFATQVTQILKGKNTDSASKSDVA